MSLRRQDPDFGLSGAVTLPGRPPSRSWARLWAVPERDPEKTGLAGTCEPLKDWPLHTEPIQDVNVLTSLW